MGKRSQDFNTSRSREQFESSIGADGAHRRAQGDLLLASSRVRREAAESSLKTTGFALSSKLETAPTRLMAERDRRRKHSHRRLIVILTAVFVLIAATAGGVGIYLGVLQSRLYASHYKGQDVRSAITYPATADKPFTVLLLGVDKPSGSNTWRSDAVILAQVDPQTKQIWLVSIPRDYAVQISGHGTQKISAAYTYGQEALAVQSVEQVTGQNINHVMTIDLAGLEDVVNAVGGVSVDVPQRIDDPAADDTPNKSASVIDAGPQILDGAHTLTLVRSLYGDTEGDFTRMKAQQLFLESLIGQVAGMSKSQLLQVTSKASYHVSTDMSLTQLLDLAQTFKGIKPDRIYTATLPGQWVSPYVVPDTAGAQGILNKLAKGQPFDSTPAVAAPVAKVDPSKITITIENGTQRTGIAKQAAAILLAHGYNVGTVGNAANQSVYQQSYVYYKTNADAAQSVADCLLPGMKVVQSNGLQDFSSEILVVIGQDWDLSKIPITGTD